MGTEASGSRALQALARRLMLSHGNRSLAIIAIFLIMYAIIVLSRG